MVAAPVAGTGAPTTPVTPVAPQEPVVDIEEEEVPLAVNTEEEVPGVEIRNEETSVVEILDEETPLAAGIGKDGIRNWWWWIAAAATAITGKGVYDHQRRKGTAKDKDESKES